MSQDLKLHSDQLVAYAQEAEGLDLATFNIDDSDLEMLPGDIVELYNYAVKCFQVNPRDSRNQYELIRACAIMQRMNSSEDFSPLLLAPLREKMIPEFQRLSELILDCVKNGDYPSDQDLQLYIFYRKQVIALRCGDEEGHDDALYWYYLSLKLDINSPQYEEELPFLQQVFAA